MRQYSRCKAALHGIKSAYQIDLVDADAPTQLDLFTDTSKHEKMQKIDDTVLELRRRFGKNAIFNACLMQEEKVPHGNPEESVMPMRMYR